MLNMSTMEIAALPSNESLTCNTTNCEQATIYLQRYQALRNAGFDEVTANKYSSMYSSVNEVIDAILSQSLSDNLAVSIEPSSSASSFTCDQSKKHAEISYNGHNSLAAADGPLLSKQPQEEYTAAGCKRTLSDDKDNLHSIYANNLLSSLNYNATSNLLSNNGAPRQQNGGGGVGSACVQGARLPADRQNNTNNKPNTNGDINHSKKPVGRCDDDDDLCQRDDGQGEKMQNTNCHANFSSVFSRSNEPDYHTIIANKGYYESFLKQTKNSSSFRDMMIEDMSLGVVPNDTKSNSQEQIEQMNDEQKYNNEVFSDTFNNISLGEDTLCQTNNGFMHSNIIHKSFNKALLATVLKGGFFDSDEGTILEEEGVTEQNVTSSSPLTSSSGASSLLEHSSSSPTSFSSLSSSISTSPPNLSNCFDGNLLESSLRDSLLTLDTKNIVDYGDNSNSLISSAYGNGDKFNLPVDIMEDNGKLYNAAITAAHCNDLNNEEASRLTTLLAVGGTYGGGGNNDRLNNDFSTENGLLSTASNKLIVSYRKPYQQQKMVDDHQQQQHSIGFISKLFNSCNNNNDNVLSDDSTGCITLNDFSSQLEGDHTISPLNVCNENELLFDYDCHGQDSINKLFTTTTTTPTSTTNKYNKISAEFSSTSLHDSLNDTQSVLQEKLFASDDLLLYHQPENVTRETQHFFYELDSSNQTIGDTVSLNKSNFNKLDLFGDFAFGLKRDYLDTTDAQMFNATELVNFSENSSKSPYSNAAHINQRTFADIAASSLISNESQPNGEHYIGAMNEHCMSANKTGQINSNINNINSVNNYFNVFDTANQTSNLNSAYFANPNSHPMVKHAYYSSNGFRNSVPSITNKLANGHFVDEHVGGVNSATIRSMNNMLAVSMVNGHSNAEMTLAANNINNNENHNSTNRPTNLMGYKGLWVCNVSPEATLSYLKRRFRRFGHFTGIQTFERRATNGSNIVFVHYDNPYSPVEAIAALHNYTGHDLCADPSEPLKLRFAPSMEQSRANQLPTLEGARKVVERHGECFNWRLSSGCHRGARCQLKHILINKEIDSQPWVKALKKKHHD